jgi:hypothetical protein
LSHQKAQGNIAKVRPEAVCLAQLGLWEAACYFHANPDKASEFGKRGGRAKSPTSTPGVSEYVARPLKSVDDVTKLLGDTINDLRSGTIDSRLANTVGFLATGMLKALQQGDLEGRLCTMEAVLSSNKTSPKTVREGRKICKKADWQKQRPSSIEASVFWLGCTGGSNSWDSWR